ncbi:hypothetical protein LPN01_17545, partial [Sphingomonas sp. A2-49]|nr:hypothetical protein [Sphingomonas sp. A2-49]
KPHRVIVKRVGKDGQVNTYTSTDSGRFADRDIQVLVDRSLKAAPEVSEQRCADGRDGGARDMVVNRQQGDRRIMVICTNRIEAMAQNASYAAAHAGEIRRNAMQTALSSVQASRADIAANRDMPAKDRAEALAEMDEALAELRAEMASPDKD